jgi:hypothetical protein
MRMRNCLYDSLLRVDDLHVHDGKKFLEYELSLVVHSKCIGIWFCLEINISSS